MQVVTAKTAGFCFGVRRAVETCYDQSSKAQGKVYTYGPIIHNEMVVRDLEARGISVIRSKQELEELKEGTVIIRSHGVEKEICDLIGKQGLKMVDAKILGMVLNSVDSKEFSYSYKNGYGYGYGYSSYGASSGSKSSDDMLH